MCAKIGSGTKRSSLEQHRCATVISLFLSTIFLSLVQPSLLQVQGFQDTSANSQQQPKQQQPFSNGIAQNFLPPPSTAQLTCNFDFGFCGWRHDNHAEFSWTRGQGDTPSGQTGPPWDHTTRDKSAGHYIYIETSSPRHSGDKARLVSPIVPHPGTYCLSFWHYMHGVGIHDLNIYRRGNGSHLYHKVIQLRGPWSVETTSQSNPFSDGEDWWNEQMIEFVADESYELIIEGVRGDNFRGDIALDDLKLLHSPCERRAVDCDFEANMCGWQQMTDDEFNWMPNKGPTQTRLTGPDRDHTFGSQDLDGGRYLYTEVSWPRTAGQKARLLSPVIYCTEDKTPLFQFWYHMYGQSVGSLRVYLRHWRGNSTDHAVWEKSGDQRKEWNLAQMQIPDDFRANLTFQIVIEATRSALHQGDIAIDDILLTGCYPTDLKKFNESHWRPVIRINGSTEPSLLYQLNCDFDKQTLCMWSSEGSERYTWQTNHGNTTSELTGPRYDHSTGDGWYIYTEASSARRGDKALLKSQPIAAQERICFKFYYHMYGKSMGRLEVLTTPLGTNLLFDKWSVDGQKSANDTDWRKTEIEITEVFDFHVVIRATRGSDFYSDIAIDDLQVLKTCNSSSRQQTTTRPNLRLNSESSTSVKDLACTFDDFTLCNWTQSYLDNFDWTVSNGGRTLSFGTGPDQDHTSGNGQFAYIESSNPRKVGDRAILESPIINITDPVCITMWWHMYGKGSGSIELRHLLISNDSKKVEDEKILWSDHGDRGNQWHKIETSIVKPGRTRMEIHGIRGSGWMSDIAIDDIIIETGECKILNCSFDLGLCGWRQERRGDVFDWKRSNGGTETAHTGPQHDHTRLGSKNGYYLFIEASNPRGKGDKARLISPLVDVDRNPKKCLTFWYHMYGNSVGEINVYKDRSNSSKAPSPGSYIWKRNRNSGDRWMLASIDLEDDNSYKIIIEGIRGWGSKGDVAIDDVSIRPGPCLRCCSSASKNFQCANFQCIPKSKQCDGVEDCEDGSDEEFCQGCGVTPIEPLTSNRYGHVIDLTLQKETKQPNIEHRHSEIDVRKVFSKEIPYVEVLKTFSKKNPQALRGKEAKMAQDFHPSSTDRFGDSTWRDDETPIFSASITSKNKLNLKRINERKPPSPNDFTMKRFREWFWNAIRKQTSRYASRGTLLDRLRRNAILKISGGNEVKVNSWPWQATYFVIDLSSTTPVSYICGATLIDRYWVLTAAHCPGLGHQHSVVLGAHDILHYTGTEQKLEVEAVYVNENYSLSNDLRGDIALVKLRTPAKSSPSVQTACLLRRDDAPFPAGHVCMTTGWGRSSRKQDIERALRQGEVPLVNNDACQNIFYPAYTIHDRLVCAGGTGANSCLGDSGGPLVCKRRDRHYLVGITSWGDADCKLNIPGAYTRVQSYMDWIEVIISHHRCPS